VPTFAEAGLPAFDGRSWQGVMAPAKTPSAIIDKLTREFERILKLADVNDSLLTMGADPFYSTPSQFAALIKSELVRYAKLIKDAKIRLD